MTIHCPNEICRRRAWFVGVVALLILWGSSAAGQETPRAYRRVLVPADKPAAWPRDGETFLPVEAGDFDTWVAAANRPPAEASIVDAEYVARLAGGQLVDGRGRWRIVLQGDGPAFLPIDRPSIVVRDARWSDRPSELAKLGWWHLPGKKPMSFGLQVPAEGELEFAWHLLRANVAGSVLEFPLELPSATITRLILELPPKLRPEVAGGVLLESPDGLPMAEPNEYRRWVFALGATSAMLRVVPTDDPAPSASPQVSVREDLRYELTKRGIDVQAMLRLDNSGPPLSELNVALPDGLKLVSATMDGRDAQWRVVATTSDTVPRAAVALPAPIAANSSVVVLRAWGPLEIGSLQRLPKPSVDGTGWTSGSIELEIDETLALREIAPIECAQSSVGERSSKRRDAQWLRFDSYAPAATVELAVGHHVASGRLRQGTQLNVGGSGVEGRLVAAIQVERGSLQSLRAELQPGWSIEAVESVPADALDEWYVDWHEGVRTLELQLQRAATRGQPVTLRITGRRRHSEPTELLTLGALAPVQWRGLKVERNLVRIEAAEPYQLEPVGDFQPIAAADLTTDEGRLVDRAADGWILDAEAGDDTAFRLTVRRGAYDAEIQCDAALEGGQLRQTYRVDCRPQGSGIDHVLVFVSEPLSNPPRWTDVETGEPLVAERMPQSDPRLGGLPPGGELWLVQLRRLYARPTAISATFATQWPARRRVPLVSLPDAATQQGRITIAGADLEQPAIIAQGLTPAPLPPSTGGRDAAPTWAVYRYQPLRFYHVGPAPELWLGPADDGDNRDLPVATKVDLQSHYAADGTGKHRAVYLVEGRGAAKFEWSLPPGVRLDSARFDGQPLPSPIEGRWTLPMPVHGQTATLELDLTSVAPPLANGGKLVSPLPTSSLSVLKGSWSIWLPYEFSADDPAIARATSGFDWRQRLFGPLARPHAERPFDPFSSGDWNTLSAGLRLPGGRSALAAQEPAAGILKHDGWHAFETRFVAAPPESITITHPPATAAWALALFLLCALGPGLWGWRPARVAILAAIVAIACLLLPAHLASLASGGFLGLTCSLLWSWFQSATGRAATASLAIMLPLLLSSALQAGPVAPVVERVLVPVDASGRLSGTKYFVTDKFLSTLIESSSRRSVPGSWLLVDQQCKAELATRTSEPGQAAGRWNLTCDIDVLTRDARITLPLIEQEAQWPPTALLDGIPTPLVWNENGNGCSIAVAEPGRYRLSIAFAPRSETDHGRRSVRLSLPPVAGASLQIATAPQITNLVVSGAAARRPGSAPRGAWHGELDGSGRLTASWSAMPAAAADVRPSVDEFLWLRIKPGGVELDVRYVARNGADLPAEMNVLVDRRWNLISAEGASAATVETPVARRQSIHLKQQPAAGRSREVLLHLQAVSTSPLGRLRVPTLAASPLSIASRTLAISCDPTLECEPPNAATVSPDATADFVTAWGTILDRTLPDFVLNLGADDSAGDFIIRPRPTESACQERLSLAAGRHLLQIVYQAEVTPGGDHRFRWPISVPAELTDVQIAVESAGRQVPLDWLRVAANRINVFFRESIDGPYRLQLDGRLPLDDFGAIDLPRITAADQLVTNQTIALYRDEAVLAAWEFRSDDERPEDRTAESPPQTARARLVRAYSIDATPADAPRIQIEANELAVDGQTLIVVSPGQDAWTATLECRVKVEHGELDVLRFRVPGTWAAPKVVTPAGATAEIANPPTNGDHAKLSIRLPQPARTGEVVTLRVDSPLVSADGQPIAAPQIVPLAAGRWQHYLALPITVDGLPIEWTKGGIEATRLPDDFPEDAPTGDRFQTFRITASSLNVAQRPRSSPRPALGVRFAETTAYLDASGRAFAATQFALAPQGSNQCIVDLPGGERLVRIALDGRAALARQVDPRRWRVQLGAPNLPQRLEVVTRRVDRIEPTARHVELARPTLKVRDRPVPVELSLWSLHRSKPASAIRVAGAAALSPAELATLRLDRLVSMSQSATRTAIELPVVDGYHWFASWGAELLAARRAAEAFRAPAADELATRVTLPADDAGENAIARSADWIGQMADVFGDAAAGPAEIDEPARDPIDFGELNCFVAEGGQDRLRIEFVPTGLAPRQGALALVSMVALAIAAAWLVGTPAAMEFLKNWPQLVGVAVGLAYWAWLRPSALGLAIAAICVVWLLRGVRRQRKSPRHDSTKQSTAIPEELAKP